MKKIVLPLALSAAALAACAPVSKNYPTSGIDRALNGGWNEYTLYQRIGEAEREGRGRPQICSAQGMGDAVLSSFNQLGILRTKNTSLKTASVNGAWRQQYLINSASRDLYNCQPLI